MDYLNSIWNVLTPILFSIVFILEIIFTMRLSQILCIKLITRLSNEIRHLYKGNGLPLAETEQGCSSFIYYTSLFLGSFLGIVLTGFFIGILMLFAVSELFGSMDIIVLPSFIISILQWAALVGSGILLFFMGLYGSRLVSYYLHKLPSPRAHTYAQFTSIGLLIFFIFMSIVKIGSAVQFINLSLLIVTFSLLMALILPLLKSKSYSTNLKTLLHRIV